MVKTGGISRALKFEPSRLRYTGIIGTGGVGSGKIFQLEGNHTLGREESRSGRLLDVRDYCKQHIILHYIKVLLGDGFTVIPVGKLGDDEIGNTLFMEMEDTGFEMDLVRNEPHLSTLFSICFQYPDGSGGNITTENSASADVDPDFIKKATGKIKKLGRKGMILAAPEVPLSARLTLLEIGKKNGLFCSASFTTGEIRETMESGVLSRVDLISVNLDEAAAISGTRSGKRDPASTVESAVQVLRAQNEHILVSVTAGSQGSWCWDGHRTIKVPAANAEVISSAGAGDAFFSGILCGIALGLDFFEAQQLATLIAGMSVTSPHTIHDGIDRKSIYRFMKSSGQEFPKKIMEFLKD